MFTITANELKTQGITRLSKAFADLEPPQQEAAVTVHGELSYVMLSIKRYEEYQRAEIIAAITEAKDDIANKRIIKESISRDQVVFHATSSRKPKFGS